MLSKHISLWTPPSSESWGAEIGCNHVDRWLTFYCSVKPNLQGWWWIQSFWNDAIPRILWLTQGAALLCSPWQDTGLSHVYKSCINRHVCHAHTAGNAVLHEDIWKGLFSQPAISLDTTITQLCVHAFIRRVQKLKCIVLSHACKHKADSHIMPYWSDRVSRKLAENTNTAWGGSLKPETSLLSMVFSSSGNHLVAHAYQVLFSKPQSVLGFLFSAICFNV